MNSSLNLKDKQDFYTENQMTALGEIYAATKMTQFEEYKSKYFKDVNCLQIDYIQ